MNYDENVCLLDNEKFVVFNESNFYEVSLISLFMCMS